ncbi:hypothetical protein GEMRC1_005506 [Eukaryota sp. GEM-RC1]
MTLRYAAPEQFDNIVTPQSDIYSLGIILYELFQNKQAFQEMSVFGLVGAKQRGISLSFDKTIPSQLAKVINGCLNSDPKLRPKISQIIEILDQSNLAKPSPQQLDHSSLQELECLEQKNQSLTDQILLLQANIRELIKQINDLKTEDFQLSERHSKFVLNLENDFNHEKQLLLETNRQLQTEFNSLNSQIEGFQNQNMISNSRSTKISKMKSNSINVSTGLNSNQGSKVEEDVLPSQNLRIVDKIRWSKVKPKVKKLCEDVRDGKVTSVDLRNNSIGVEGARLLAEALQFNDSVTSLQLRSNSVGAEGAIALAEVLAVNASLTSFGLRSNSVGAVGARALAEALTVNASLTSIDLWNNSIGNAGARALAEALTVNASLTSIDLWNNSIGNAGARALAEALAVNDSLKSVNMSYNSIGDEGVKALAEALKVNTSITIFDLSCNSIGNQGAGALADALKVNSSITTLDLRQNSIGNAGAIALSEALKVNGLVTSIDLAKNSIGVKGARALAETLEVNPRVTIGRVSQLNKS